jgi:hypothetical protein
MGNFPIHWALCRSEHVYVARTVLCFDNDAKWTHFCISTAIIKILYCCHRHVPKRCKGKALSNLHGSIFRVFTSLTDKNLHKTHRMHFCFTKAIMLTETRHTITLHIHSVPCDLRQKPAMVYNVAHHNNVYVRNMSGFDITAKLWELCFDGHYCNELITVLTETTIEPNYDKCNQYKGIPVLYHQYVKYQFSANHNKLTLKSPN